MGDRRGVHREYPGIDGRIILRKWNVGAWTGLIYLRTGTGVGCCECGNEPSGWFHEMQGIS